MENVQPSGNAEAQNEVARKNFWQSFREFLKQYSVIGLAIGIVMGTAVNRLVQSVVDGLITPLIGLLVPNQGLQKLSVKVHGSDFLIGGIINAFIQFIVVALLIYFVVKMLLRQDELLKKK